MGPEVMAMALGLASSSTKETAKSKAKGIDPAWYRGTQHEAYISPDRARVMNFDPMEDCVVITHDSDQAPRLRRQKITEEGLLLTLSNGMVITLVGLMEKIPESLVRFMNARDQAAA